MREVSHARLGGLGSLGAIARRPSELASRALWAAPLLVVLGADADARAQQDELAIGIEAVDSASSAELAGELEGSALDDLLREEELAISSWRARARASANRSTAWLPRLTLGVRAGFIPTGSIRRGAGLGRSSWVDASGLEWWLVASWEGY